MPAKEFGRFVLLSCRMLTEASPGDKVVMYLPSSDFGYKSHGVAYDSGSPQFFRKTAPFYLTLSCATRCFRLTLAPTKKFHKVYKQLQFNESNIMENLPNGTIHNG